MANFKLNMVEQEYITAERKRISRIFTFPEIPYKGVQIIPDSLSDGESTNNPSTRSVIEPDSRRVITSPHLVGYTKCNGRIQANFTSGDNVVVKYGTAFVIAENWIMTTALNVYDPVTDKFADSILYYPALGGNKSNPVYDPVNVTRAFIHPTIINLAQDNTMPLYNIALLKLDSDAPKPEGYCGLRYQYDSYANEAVIVLGYPEDLPENTGEMEKGTYMYMGLGQVTLSSDANFIYHKADTSSLGYSGSPLYLFAGDGNGYVTIGMNAYENGANNVGIKFNRLIYGILKSIREQPNYCGGVDYKNIYNHSVTLQNDAYYKCDLCGYRVPSPSLQDKNILTRNDYLMVLAAQIIYGFTAASGTYEMLYYPLFTDMWEIRTKEQYDGKYGYQGENGKCLMIEPELYYTTSSLTTNFLDPVTITSANIDMYNGFFNAITEFIFGLAVPTSIAAEIQIAEREIILSGNPTPSLFFIMKSIIEKAGEKAFGIILNLMEIGTELMAIEGAREFVVGDSVVEFQYSAGNTYYIHVVFDENDKFKNIIFSQL